MIGGVSVNRLASYGADVVKGAKKQAKKNRKKMVTKRLKVRKIQISLMKRRSHKRKNKVKLMKGIKFSKCSLRKTTVLSPKDGLV